MRACRHSRAVLRAYKPSGWSASRSMRIAFTATPPRRATARAGTARHARPCATRFGSPPRPASPGQGRGPGRDAARAGRESGRSTESGYSSSTSASSGPASSTPRVARDFHLDEAELVAGVQVTKQEPTPRSGQLLRPPGADAGGHRYVFGNHPVVGYGRVQADVLGGALQRTGDCERVRRRSGVRLCEQIDHAPEPQHPASLAPAVQLPSHVRRGAFLRQDLSRAEQPIG